jgi:toxin CcdB
MAQYDVHRIGDGLVVDCQSDLLAHIASRFVVPLVPRAEAPVPAGRLNPAFQIDGLAHIMVTEAAAAVPAKALGPVVESLRDRSFEITDALDVLISGV